MEDRQSCLSVEDRQSCLSVEDRQSCLSALGVGSPKGQTGLSVLHLRHEDLPAPEYPSAPETQPDHMCAREQLRLLLDKAMTTLPERYKRSIRRHGIMILFEFTVDLPV